MIVGVLFVAFSYRQKIGMRLHSLGVSLFFLCFVSPTEVQVLLRGHVEDAQTGASLAAAHIQVEGTNHGTITNTEGRFELIVPGLPVVLSVRYIGYQTKRVSVGQDAQGDLRVLLQPAVIELGELYVTGEDFATNIMRKVIEQKQIWTTTLSSYRVDGYSKVVLETPERIVLLSESVFDAYWDAVRGPREVIKSWRKTADFFDRFKIAPAGYIPNLYNDYVEVQGVNLIGPTHPMALDYYRFTLADQRALDDLVIYDIYIAPKTLLHPTFIGRISIVDEEYAMLEAEVRPGRHVEYPEPIHKWDVFYSQQYARFDDTFWLPIDLRLDGKVCINVAGMGELTPAFHQVSRLSGYMPNHPVPDSLYSTSERVSVDTQSVNEDYLFLMGRNIVPLTPRETVALENARGKMPPTLEEAFIGPGLASEIAAFESARYADDEPQFRWPRFLGYVPWLWFNRVDGYAVGFTRYLIVPPKIFGELRLAQTTGRGRVRLRSMLQYRWGRGYLLEGGYTANTDSRNRSSIYPLPINTLPGRLGQGDYFDYFWNKKAYIKAGIRLPRFRFNVSYHREKHTNVFREIDLVWPFTDTLRTNPSVDPGLLETAKISAVFGDGYKPFRAGAVKRIEASLERSLPDTDFDFTQFQFTLDWRFRTFFRYRLTPNALDIRLYGGTYQGILPVQRLGVLDGSLGPFGTLGVFRSLRGQPYEGEQYIGVFWEHDFTTLPFEWLGLRSLVRSNMGFRLFGAHGRTWISSSHLQKMTFTPRFPESYHHEMGISITNILGSPIRLDLTYRLDQPGFFFGVGLTRFE